LLGLQPKTAIVIQDQQEKELPITEIKTGMLVRIRPGDKIPVDGVITEGESNIDESMLTGEAMPVTKRLNDNVIAGTLNKSGAFIFKVMHVGTETTLAKIIALVKQAQGSKPAIGRLVDCIGCRDCYSDNLVFRRAKSQLCLRFNYSDYSISHRLPLRLRLRHTDVVDGGYR
jgi:Cu+-exporting ATPase